MPNKCPIGWNVRSGGALASSSCISYRGVAIGAWLSAIRTTAAGQRLDTLDLFARLLIEGCVAEVDVPVQAHVGVVLVVVVAVGLRYSGGVHRDLFPLGRAPGVGPRGGLAFAIS